MNANQEALSAEQAHFDVAWEARERKRATLQDAPKQAAGPRAAAAAVRRGAERELETVGRPDDPVAFGRFDMADGEVVYVGKHLISTENRDTLVINWKTRFAEPYFAATYDDPRGLRLRRKFDTDRNTVKDFEEIVFEELARRVGGLTGLERSGLDDTVLRDLEKDRTGEMQDIVQTIHASQYGLVRSPLGQLLIVQGGPGTGKTAVALHRVSWLLFNHLQELTPDDVLVVGPNPTFTKYIKSVLPGLGDNEVGHRDLLSLGVQASSSRPEDNATARLKGAARMADLLATALRQRVRVPERMESLDLGQGVRFTASELEILLDRLVRQPYAAGRAAARIHLADEAARRATRTVSPNQIENGLERLWPSLTPMSFLRDLLGSRERLVAAAGDDFTAGDVSRLLRTPAERISEETWTDTDVALLDEADALINQPPRSYAHLVVDEAQDLSPMQLRSLRRRSATGSMTLVGDLAQSTGHWARDSWDDIAAALVKDHPVKLEELALGYRVPQQVFELAVKLLPEAAPGVVRPRVVRPGPADPRLERVDVDDVVPTAIAIAQQQAGLGLFVGVICPDSLRGEVIDGMNKRGVVFSDASKGGIGKSINLVSPAEAKGLEFDSVVVLEPERIVAEYDRGLRMLYVAFTRTTRYLAVVHNGRLLPLDDEHSSDGEVLPPAVADVPADVTAPPAEAREPAPLVSASLIAPEKSEPVGDDLTLDLPPVRMAPEAPQESAFSSSTPSVTVTASDLTELVIGAAAAGLADSVRSGVPAALWPRLIDRLRQELGVSSEQVLDLLE